LTYEQAKELIDDLLHTHSHLNGTKVASARFDKALAKLLTQLMGRKPTKEELAAIE